MSTSTLTKPLTGASLWIAAISIGMANFLVVLDSTIANVSIPTIAGSLGISSTEGTWVITFYAVAEAITVLMAGWLANRFGEKRVFLTAYISFAAMSFLCAISVSINMLIFARILLGMMAGPIMALSLMMLMRIFPKEQATTGTVIWSMTSLIGPIAGPVLGGWLCDNYGWHWIFLVNVPIAIGGGLLTMYMLRDLKDVTSAQKIDAVGLGLLAIWIAAIQVVLDEGRNQDWFASTEVVVMAIIAAIGFIAFLIWEWTEKNPLIDLRIFRHRGFTMAVATSAVGFGAFSAVVVILPLWLQQNMGYTATWAGLATGMMGLLAIVSSPLVGKAVNRFDPRAVVSIGLLGLGMIAVWRTGFTPDITFEQMAWPTLATGPFMVMFFVPLTGLVLASVNPEEQVAASSISTFLRTIAGAFGTSLVQSGWSDATRSSQTEIVNAATNLDAALQGMTAAGTARDAGVASINSMIEGQSVMLATLDMFGTVALVFAVAAAVIWLAPRPKGPIQAGGGH